MLLVLDFSLKLSGSFVLRNLILVLVFTQPVLNSAWGNTVPLANQADNENLYASFNNETEYKLIPNARHIFLHRAFNLKFIYSADLKTVTTNIDGTPFIGSRIR